eukprot:13311893-Alexandrium_andersonii.AAC.1
MHHAGASGTKFEAVLGSAQLKLQRTEAVVHVLKGGLRTDADCSIDGPWSGYGLRVGHLAMHRS